MVTGLYLLISLAALACLVWSVRILRAGWDFAVFLIALPLSLLWYDSFLIATGRFIGEGEVLLALSWPRYIAHAVFLPAWIAAAGLIARRADLSWAQPVFVTAIFFLLALGGFGLGVLELLSMELYPVCLNGTLRYVTYVSEGQACEAATAGLGHAPQGPPIVPVVATILFLIIGIMLWISQKWPWLALGSIVMFAMAGMPQSIAGPLLANMAEPLIAAAALLTARRFQLTSDNNQPEGS